MSRSRSGVSFWVAAVLVGAALGEGAVAQVADPVPKESTVTTPGAADTGASSDGLQEVQITGTRIRTPNSVSVSPVVQVDAEQFEERGAIRIEDVLNRMPEINGSQGDNSSNRGISGTAQVDLRGLGPTRTLVLIDGQRMGYGSPKTEPADLNLIPTELIKNVQVLTGGASAVYGSDAIAGVVNISLIDNFDGFQIGTTQSIDQHHNDNKLAQNATTPWEAANPGQYNEPQSNIWDGHSEDFTLLFGHNFDDHKGNITAYATTRTTEAVTEGSRDFSACKFGPATGGESYTCAPSPVGTPASFVTAGAPGLPPQFRVSSANGGQFVPLAPYQNYFNDQPYSQLQRPDQRYTFGVLAHEEINEHLAPFLQINFARTHTFSDYSPGAVQTSRADPTGTINCDNPFLTAQEQNYLCTSRGLSTASIYNPTTGAYIGPASEATGISLNRRSIEDGDRHDDYTLSEFRMLIGTKGTIIGPFDYQVSASYSNSTLNRFQTGLPSQIRAVTALNAVLDKRPGSATYGQAVCAINADASTLNDDPNCSPLNYYSGTGPSAAAAKYIYAKMVETGQTSQTDILATINGDLSTYGLKSPFAHNGFATSFGAEYRENSLNVAPDEEFQAQMEDYPVQGSQTVTEEFVELNAPLVQDVPGMKLVSLEGAFRHSDYKDSVSTNTFKAGLNFAPVDDVRLRTSFQRAVRAPNILELYSAQLRQITLQLPINKNGYYDPCAGPTPAASVSQCANTGVTAAEYGHIADYNFFPQVTGGNPNLKPETAKTYSIGGVLTPRFIKNFTLSVDYYHIEVNNLISTIAPTLSLSTCLQTGDPYFCSLVHRGTGGTLFSSNDAYILSTNVNTGELLTDGIDVSSDYKIRLPPAFGHNLGGMDLGFSGTYVQKYWTKPLPNSTAAQSFDCAGYYEYNCGAPRPKWRHNLVATWSAPGLDLSFSTTWRYISHVELSRASTDQPVLEGSYAPIDKYLSATSYIDMSAAYRWRELLTFRVGVNNILDKDPPLSTIVNSTSGGNGNTYPQFYDTLGRVIFGTVSAKF